ncbi:hypothetical protein [Roseateles sp. P5_E4]
METRVYGDLNAEGLEVVCRAERYFVRYDAGAHQMAWREDEITLDEFNRLRVNRTEEYEVIIELQRRIRSQGNDPNCQNWVPSQHAL